MNKKEFCKHNFDGYCYCPHSNRCNGVCPPSGNSDCRHFDYSVAAKRFPNLYAAVKSIDWWTLAGLAFVVSCGIGFVEMLAGIGTIIGLCGLILEFFTFLLGLSWYLGRKFYLIFKANCMFIKEVRGNGRE